MHRCDEFCEVDRCLPRIGNAVGVGVLAVDPAVHRPAPGVAVPRLSHLERLGHREGQEWRDPGEPRVLLLDLLHRPRNERQSHDEVVAEAVDRVVGAVGLESPDRECRPIGN